MTISSFLGGSPSRRSSKQTYWYQLKKYLRYVQPHFKGTSIEDFEPLAKSYLVAVKAGARDLVKDLRGACAQCNTPSTASSLRSSVLEYLRFHDFFPDERTLYHLRKGRKPIRAVTVDRPLGVEDLQKILAQMDVRARAVTYVMLSSGARIGEVLALGLGSDRVDADLDLVARPAKITIRETKTGQPRISFISQEAAAAVQDYLKVRDRYVASARARHGAGLEGLLFPVSYRTFQGVWALAVRKAGLEKHDPRTRRLVIPPHSCRKFFMSKMKGAGVPDEIVEVLAGHALNLGGAYARYTEEELAQAFLSGEPAVTITRAAGIEKLEVRLRRQEQQMEDLMKAFEAQKAGRGELAGDGGG
jgi:integrase